MTRVLCTLAVLVWTGIAQAQGVLKDHARDTLIHVLAHEIGHALVREFDLAALGNEEVAADQFATYHLHRTMPDRVEAIVRARVRSWMIQADEESIFAEHPGDVRRAGYTLCFLHGLDPDRFGDLPEESGMTVREAAACRDSAPEIARAWRRVLAQLAMPVGARVTEVRIDFEQEAWHETLEASGLGEVAWSLLSGFDWHSQITLLVADCDGGARWQRNGRTIRICDALIERFQNQVVLRERPLPLVPPATR